MPGGLGDIVQKAFYLGVGLASYAGEKAGSGLAQLRTQAQKLADEMVARGEMNAEEARKFVEDIVNKAQQPQPSTSAKQQPAEPRRIEIEDDEDTPPAPSDAERLRQQVQDLQDELRRLQKE
jgi:polyhydroxyalkanoate synthesis regulator phasin